MKNDEHFFIEVQNLAYNCTIEIGKLLQEGWSEKQCANLMNEYLKDHGVKNFFHKSFAWFGERTQFRNFKTYYDFLPKNHSYYDPTKAVILDTAPILNGYVGDVGYSFHRHPNQKYLEAKKFLKKTRSFIQEKMNLFSNLSDLWKKIDQDFLKNNYINCHSQYPFGVLGHRVHKLNFTKLPSLTSPFGFQGILKLFQNGVYPDLLSINHKYKKSGFWAIEPHLGQDDFGIKFEEILYIAPEGDCRWLTNNVPHIMEENL